MARFLNSVMFNPTLGGTTDWVVSSAVLGFMTPALAGAATGTYKYRAESADLTQWEIGEGTYTTGTVTLTRTTVLYNSSGTGTGAGQSGAGTKINFTNPPYVAIVQAIEDTLFLDTDNVFTATQKKQALKNLSANKGYFHVTRGGTNQTGFAAGGGKVQLTTEDVDSQSWWDAATNYRFQPTEGGWYFFSGQINAAGGGAETAQAYLMKNGTIVKYGLYLSTNLSIFSPVSALLSLNGSSDYVELGAYLPSGVTTVSGDTRYTFLSGWKVGEL